jgi:hypothetical protein
MRTSKPVKGSQSIKIPGAAFTGINKHDSIAKLEPGDYLELRNVDIEDGWISHRRGTEPSEIEIDTQTKVYSSVSFVSEVMEQEITLIQIASPNKEGHFYGSGATEAVKEWGTTDIFVGASNQQDQYIYANGKVYLISTAGNYVFEFVEIDTGNEDPWDNYQLWARPLGIAKAQIDSVVETVTGDANDIPEGKYVYAVEFVRKQATTGAAISSSSPNRFLKGTTNFAYLTVSAADVYSTARIHVEVDDIIASPSVTHVRLWRSKSTVVNPVTFDTPGDETTIFLIDEVPRSVAVAPGAGNDYEFHDFRKDEDIPNYLFGNQSMGPGPLDGPVYYEWEPLPEGYVGAYYANRVWVGHINSETTGFINDNSNLAYSGPAATLYNELYDPANGVIQCESGDGYTVTKIQGMSGNLIVFKQNSTGMIPDGLPENPYQVLDESIGVAYLNSAQFISRYGVMGVVNDEDLVMLFGLNLTWSPYIGSVNFSRKLLDTYTLTPGATKGVKKLFKAVYWEGKIVMHIGEGRTLSVLHVAEGRFWSEYFMPFGYLEDNVSGESSIETLFLRDGGKQVAFSIWNNPTDQYVDDSYLFVFRQHGADNPNLAPIDVISKPEVEPDVSERIKYLIKTAPFQHEDGRSIIEHRYLSVMAAVHEPMTVSVYLCNLTSQVADQQPMALTPTSYTQGPLVTPPAFQVNESSVVEYQFYMADQDPARTKAYGERLIYEIEGEGKLEMLAPDLYCRLTYGTRKPDYNFSKYLPNVSISTDMAIHLTRVDMTLNIGFWGGVMPPETI